MVPTPPIGPTSKGSSNNGWFGDPELWGAETPLVQPTTRGTTDDTDSFRLQDGVQSQHVVVDVFLGRVALPLGVRERAGYASVSSASVSIFRWG